MRVSLRHDPSNHARPGPSAEIKEPMPLLHSRGPDILIGGHQGADGLAAPIRPGADSLFGPRGACLAAEGGPLFVSDTGHHRLLIWPECPSRDGEAASLLIGQPDFGAEGRNAKGEVGPATLNVPTGVAAADGVLAVADAWNHRVLIWRSFPSAPNQPADIVLGQSDFDSNRANRGFDHPTADTLNWCYGVTIAEGRLFVADTGNRRVLMWDRIPDRNGAPADLVLGQSDFDSRDENAGGGVNAFGMRWPHALAARPGGLLALADAGNNRVMVWRTLPGQNGAPCEFVIGQSGPDQQENNGAAYFPTDETVSMPYGLSILGEKLIVADTANSRLLGFDLVSLDMGAGANRLGGQNAFTEKGDNRWGLPVRDSLCWPYGVTACADTLIIADSGNNRISIWEAVR